MKKTENNQSNEIDEKFNDLMDLEYLEMLELIEGLKRDELTIDELKKLDYIKKTRENLYGGDA